MIDLRRTRSLLRAAAILGWCGVVACVALAAWLTSSPRAEGQRVEGPRGSTRPATRPTAPTIDDAAFAPLMTLALRRPLVDAPAAPAVALAPATGASGVGLALKGTIVEAGGASLAVFATAGGRVAIVAVGGRVDGAEVVAVDRDSATIRYGGDARPLTLTVPRPKDPTTAPSAAAAVKGAS